jgi:hypothetical protein
MTDYILGTPAIVIITWVLIIAGIGGLALSLLFDWLEEPGDEEITNQTFNKYSK